MAEGNNPAAGDDEDEDADDLCSHAIELEDDEVTGDEDLPAATGGVEE
ncbi:MAG TPA: hypothetical protein VGW40_00280 [Allosphingosinicella sp.]|nr:hypothetical protein [Allosphingosinicella sp.]